MSDERRMSPLQHRRPIHDGFGQARLAEKPFHGIVVLRGSPRAIGRGAEGALGFALPAVKKSARAGGSVAIWLSPDEWVVVTEPDLQTNVIDELSQSLSGTHHQVVDVSDYYTIIEIIGQRVRDLLAKLTTIDLHPRTFEVGDAVATTFAKATGWLVLTKTTADKSDGATAPNSDHFQLIVRRSFADYLWCLLAEAGREWGLPEQDPIGQVRVYLPHFDDAQMEEH